MGMGYGSVCASVTCVAVLITAIVLIAASLKKLESTEVGVTYDTQERELGAVEGEGLHAGPPFFEFKEFSAVFITRDVKTKCVSQDGLEVDITASFQYLPSRADLEGITRNYTDSNRYDELVVVAGTSAIHHACGDFNISEFQSKRFEVQQRMVFYMEGLFSFLRSNVSGVQLQNINAPDRWEAAVEEKEDAREDIALAGNERQQAVTKARTRLKVAEADARVILANAERDAAVILTKARAQATALTIRLQTEVNKTRDAAQKLNLTTDGMLRYILNRQMETKPEVIASLKPPGTTPRDEL